MTVYANFFQIQRHFPMGHQIEVCFDRGPDFFASAKLQADDPWTLAAFDDHSGKAIACFSAGTRRMLVGGETRGRLLSV